MYAEKCKGSIYLCLRIMEGEASCVHKYTCLNLLQTTGTEDEFRCHNLGISCHLICSTMSTFQSIRACGS